MADEREKPADLERDAEDKAVEGTSAKDRKVEDVDVKETKTDDEAAKDDKSADGATGSADSKEKEAEPENSDQKESDPEESETEGSTEIEKEPLPVSEALRDVAKVLTSSLETAVASAEFGELTVDVDVKEVGLALELIHGQLAVEMCLDVSAVHWPGGKYVVNPQETTGWADKEENREGHFEVLWWFRSLSLPRTFRLRTKVSDVEPHVPTATKYWAGANFNEREVWDLMGVVFVGHPDLRRIMMPDDWVGHPVRKDSPLGGVEVAYHGASVPPADERNY